MQPGTSGDTHTHVARVRPAWTRRLAPPCCAPAGSACIAVPVSPGGCPVSRRSGSPSRAARGGACLCRARPGRARPRGAAPQPRRGEGRGGGLSLGGGAVGQGPVGRPHRPGAHGGGVLSQRRGAKTRTLRSLWGCFGCPEGRDRKPLLAGAWEGGENPGKPGRTRVTKCPQFSYGFLPKPCAETWSHGYLPYQRH
jgi:hypothetical protein